MSPVLGKSMETGHAVTGRRRLEGSIIYDVVLSNPVWDFTSIACFLPICCFPPSVGEVSPSPPKTVAVILVNYCDKEKMWASSGGIAEVGEETREEEGLRESA